MGVYYLIKKSRQDMDKLFISMLVLKRPERLDRLPKQI